MKRLFYFTGYRLSVMHWRGKELVGGSSFEPTDRGFQNFRAYLEQTENIRARFLVDVIEEDFRNEKIPHVGKGDRKAVITRLIDRYYRSSKDYCYSVVIGREKTGRKDDIILLGAMTNPQLIEPWLNIIDECEVPLSGIWSLPLISQKLLRHIKASSGIVLLVSQQVNSNVRQTLFRDGKLVSSRQSIINQDKADISGIGKLAAPEVSRTVEFLRAQGHIEYDEVVDMHILGSNEQLVSLREAFKDNDRQSVSIHSISDIHKKLGLNYKKEQFSNHLFAWLCASRHLTPTHYGAKQNFKRYYNLLGAAALYAASILAVVATVLLTEANISDAMEYERSIGLLERQESNYKELYSKKFKDFEGVFENAGVMNSAVALADQIKSNSNTSPLHFMLALSEILSRDSTEDLYIDKIEWQAININEKNKKSSDANFTSRQSAKHSAVITGRIEADVAKYRQSVNRIQRIIDYLESDKRVEEVIALRLPVDLRSESKFTTESGVNVKPRGNRDKLGVFTIKVTMKAPGHV